MVSKYGGFNFDHPQESLAKIRSAAVRAISSKNSHNFWDEFKYILSDYFGLDKQSGKIFCFESRSIVPTILNRLFGESLASGQRIILGEYEQESLHYDHVEECCISITKKTDTYIPLFGNPCPDKIDKSKVSIEFNPYLLGGAPRKGEPRVRLSQDKDLYMFSAAIPGLIDCCSGLVVYSPNQDNPILADLERAFPMSQLGAALGIASLESILEFQKPYFARRREIGKNFINALDNRVEFPNIDFKKYRFPFIPMFVKNKAAIKERMTRNIPNLCFFDHIYQGMFDNLLLLPIRASWSDSEILQIITTFLSLTDLKDDVLQS